MIKYFIAEESPYKNNRYTIKMNFDVFPSDMAILDKGSFNILKARLMGLSYAQYLRMCRDLFGADIIGKNSLYPVAYFNKDENLNMLVKLLNRKMELIMALKKGIAQEYKDEYVAESKEKLGTVPDDSFFKDVIAELELHEENKE